MHYICNWIPGTWQKNSTSFVVQRQGLLGANTAGIRGSVQARAEDQGKGMQGSDLTPAPKAPSTLPNRRVVWDEAGLGQGDEHRAADSDSLGWLQTGTVPPEQDHVFAEECCVLVHPGWHRGPVAWWGVTVISRHSVTLDPGGHHLLCHEAASASHSDVSHHGQASTVSDTGTDRNVARENHLGWLLSPLCFSLLPRPPLPPSPHHLGWISSASAEGVWHLTENIRTLLRSHNYQQWNRRDNQTFGGSRGARVHSPAVGPRLLGLLGPPPPDICRITGSHLIHGKASLLSALCQQVVVPRDYLVVVWPTFIIIVMSE